MERVSEHSCREKKMRIEHFNTLNSQNKQVEL